MNEAGLNKPKRQSPVGVAVIFFKNLRVGINIFISLFFVQYGFKVDTSSNFFTVSAIIILIVFILLSYFQYRRFFFYAEGDKFIIEKGLFNRDKITVPFDRIQSVHITQNLVQQFLGVVGLKIDTAGSSVKELEISALERGYAKELQEFLIHKKSRENTDDNNEAEDAAEIKKREKPLVKLTTGDIFKIGLTENHLRTGLVLFAVINGYLWQYEEYLLRPFEPYLEEQKNYLLSQWLILLPFAVIAFITVSVLLSLIQSFLRYYKLIFFMDRHGVRLVSGLLKRVEYQIPVNKIQYIRWSSNPLRKMIGLKTIVVKQAGSNEASDKQSLKIPGSRQEQVEAVANEFFPERGASPLTEIKANIFLAYQRSMLFGLLPVLICTVLGFIYPFFWYIAPVWLGVAVFWSVKFARTVKLQYNKDLILFSRGWIFPQTAILKYFKLQSIRINQNVFQKRRGLVNLDFYTAAGSLRMWQVEEETAMKIYDYVLYKVESSREKWM